MGSVGQETRRRDFGSGIKDVEITSKAAHGTESTSTPDSTAVCGKRRPGQREFDGDNVGVGIVAEIHELDEQFAGVLELVAELVTQAKIVVQRLTKVAHDALGHGWATQSRARSSTLA